MAATVLCPKMKVPTSTDTTPQTSKQHLPSQQMHVSTHFPGAVHRQAQHTQKMYYLKPSGVTNLEKYSGYPP